MLRYYFAFIILILNPLLADQGHIFSAGAEACHMTRLRAGGAHQSGYLNGVRMSYDHLADSWLYFGGDYFTGQAHMEGKSASQTPIVSVLKDVIAEGRVGYIKHTKTPPKAFFALFSGYGLFHEVNAFCDPSPLTVTFTDTFSYLPVGLLSGMELFSMFTIGLNIKAMFMINGMSDVTDDPIGGGGTLLMNNEWNSRFELPITFSPPQTFLHLFFGFVPFAEFRHFGGREGFPFDFLDTKFQLIGGRLSLMASF